MSRVLRKNYIGAFLVMLFALLLSMSAFAETINEVKIPVEVTRDADEGHTDETMTVTVRLNPVRVDLTSVEEMPEFDQSAITFELNNGETKKSSFTMGVNSSDEETTTADPSAAYMDVVESDVVPGFTEPGDYIYEITQSRGNIEDYIYDETEYYAVVSVRNNEDNNLEASVKACKKEDYKDIYNEDEAKAKAAKQEIKFENYTCYSDPPVKKVVVNDNGTAPDDVKFRFSMKADDKSYPMPSGSVDGVKTITTGVGEYEFGNMYYKELGTYTYKVVEENDGAPHFTYDGTMYTVKVEVKMQDGKLVADRTITYGDLVTDIATFTNHYKESTDNGGSSTTTTSGGGSKRSEWNDGEEYNDPAGSVLGAVRDAIEDGPVGQVLGAARDLVEDSPVGQVLGAVRGATRTGDNSFMMVSGLCFLAAMAVLAGWVKAYIKRTR